LSGAKNQLSDQKENNEDDPSNGLANAPVVEAAVWSRGGEGPHAFVEPVHHIELSDESGTAGGAAANPAAMAPVLTADDKVVQSVFAVAPQAPVPEASKVADAAAQAQTLPESQLSEEKKEEKEPEGPKPINQNDVAIGYAILLGVVGLGYIGNNMFGGTCFVSDRLNAICALIFFCIPALCSACLLSGDKDLRLKGVFAAVPSLMIILWGAWYYHIFDQIKNDIGPYGDRVSSSHENGWDICRYDCNWDYGNQTASTMTRERPAGPELRFVRRMAFGELP
jgi:hypothetical protein